MSKKVEKTLPELEEALEIMKVNLNNPNMNAMMIGQVKKRIADTELKIAEMKKGKKEPVAKIVKATKEKPATKEKVVKEKAPKKEPKETETTLTKKDVAELKANPKVSKVLEITFPKHLVQYKLHLLKLSIEEIMALTGSPKPATIRNIWYYTSGKKSL